MLFDLIAVIFPTVIGIFLTKLQFESYYVGEEGLMAPIFALCVLAALCISLPALGKRRKIRLVLSLIFPFAFCYTFFYNNFCFYIPVCAGAALLLVIRPKKRVKTKFEFTDNSAILEMKYYTRRTGRDCYIKATNVLMVLSITLMLVSFFYDTPSRWWFVRAFPQGDTPIDVSEVYAIPSGQVTNASWHNDEALLVVDFFDIETEEGTVSPCKDAGMQVGDIVTKINGQDALSSDFITDGGGETIEITLLRINAETADYDELTFTVTPVYSTADEAYRIGMSYYTGAALSASVQTLSFYEPYTGVFAATAHSSEEAVADIENRSGMLYSAYVTGRDETGLVSFPTEYISDIYATDDYGAYGKLVEFESMGELPIAAKSEVKRGKATLISSFDGGECEEYDIYITGTYRIEGRDVLTFLAADERLVAFGGVARGMSGSPIVQNGKIVAALSNMDKGGYSAYATYACDMVKHAYDAIEEYENAEAAE